MTERKKREDQKSPKADERRGSPRHDATKLGRVVTRVVGGGEVHLLDFSRNGVLLESDSRLDIGRKVTVRITTTDASITVHGVVVRSKVAGVNNRIVYHTALALDDDLTALEKQAANAEPPVAETEADLPVASGSEHACWSDLDTGVEASSDPILEFLATVPHDLAELRRRAAVNNW
jgi:hypothetical protein